jgi:ParB family transcriptional regulator, chromosome partitioning protein
MQKNLNSERTKLKNLAPLLLDEHEDISSNREIEIAKIDLPLKQPRRYFDPEKMQELVASIKQHGVLEPILLRSIQSDQYSDRYELVAGERRFRACKEIGLSKIPAIVKELSDEEASLIRLVENLHRENLNPVEETEAILQILTLKLEMPQEQAIAILYRMRHEVRGEVEKNTVSDSDVEIIRSTFEGFGLIKWETFISHRLPLLNLPDEVLEALRQGQIEYTKATAISTVKDADLRESLLNETINKGFSLVQIKEKIRDIKVGKAIEKPVTLRTRFVDSMQKLKKSPVWDDKRKQKYLEKLIVQIESLIGQEETIT